MTGGTSPATHHSPRLTRLLGSVVRLMVAGALGWCVALAVVAPEIPRVTAATAIVILALALWSPAIALVITVALVPAGLLLAPIPASAAEMVTWAFLAGWLAAVWRPLAPSRLLPRLPSPPSSDFVTISSVYAACLVISWAGLVLAGAGGVDPAALGGFFIRALPADHLIFSSPEPETWNFLNAITHDPIIIATRTRKLCRFTSQNICVRQSAKYFCFFNTRKSILTFPPFNA